MLGTLYSFSLENITDIGFENIHLLSPLQLPESSQGLQLGRYESVSNSPEILEKLTKIYQKIFSWGPPFEKLKFRTESSSESTK